MSSPTTNASDQPTARTYFGWQHERVAFIFGMSGRRAAMIFAAVLLAVTPLAESRMSVAAVSWPIAIVLAVLAFLRIGGRTTDEWAAAFASYQVLRLREQHKFLSGPFTPYTRTDMSKQPAMDLPGVLAPVRILRAESAGSEMGVLHNRRAATRTAVARIRSTGIGLVDSHRRDQRVSGWGQLLSGLCQEGNPIIRVQAFQRILPESGAALRAWHRDHLAQDAPRLADEVAGSLLATATLSTSRRESFLAFTFDERKAAGAIKTAGGGQNGALTVLTRLLRPLTGQIQSADLEVEAWLSPRDLAEVIRTAYDPDSVQHLAERRAATQAAHTRGVEHTGIEPGVDPKLAGPMAAEARPGSYAHDGALSVTYWVENWPRNQVFATALAPVLGEGRFRRAFSLHVEPLSPRTAEREVMRERTARSVAVCMRQRTGQIVPEHERAALERADAQDAERAAGHGLVRFSAYLTVTVTNPALLDDACAALEADAAAARLEIRRVWFAQDVAFAMGALPVGYGLPKKRW
jgi:hypothetical protein